MLLLEGDLRKMGSLASLLLPRSATPVSCFMAWAGIVTVVASAKILSPTGNILLDFHVGVSEVDLNNISFWVFNVDAKLLRAFWGSERFTQFNLASLILSSLSWD